MSAMLSKKRFENEGVAPATLFDIPWRIVKSLLHLAGVMATHASSLLLAFLLPELFLLPQLASAQGFSMTLIQGLSFGSIAGTTTIPYNAANAAEFYISFPASTGPANTTTFVPLPTNLTDAYGDQLPISFSATSAAYNVGTNSTTGSTVINPNSNPALSANAGTTAHNDYFWLGGTVTPGTYTAGTYTGIVTVVFTVTGYTAPPPLSIPITVTLTGTISLSATGALNFGQIIVGTTPASLLATAAGAPEFTATLPAHSNLTPAWAATSTLNGSGGGTLTFTPSVYGNTTNTQTGSTSVTNGHAIALGTNTSYYFWLGGALTPTPIPAGQKVGAYSGTFVLKVTY
ncbi:MAG: DUF4402 domain-containing protein [Candidatus Kryptoniota bacterium]